MHIMEGFLPLSHAVGWSAASAPFLAYGVHRLNRAWHDHPEQRMTWAAATGFMFVLTALKLPSVTGSSSHPTGTGLATGLLGPAIMPVLAALVLLFQALLLAHGGLTTLGANVFSLGVVGPLAAWAVFRPARRLGAFPAVFLATLAANLATYLTTAFQLGLAFPDPAGGVTAAVAKFAAIFAPTQVPLAVAEGLLAGYVFQLLRQHAPAWTNRVEGGQTP